jgi:elongator complex protein 1
MRNLRNVRFGRWSHADITSACWDPEKDEVVCTVGPTAESPKIELVRIAEDDIT